MTKIKIVNIGMPMNREKFIQDLQLNSEQEAILRLSECNVLVNAGAGSGKTKVLTDRIIYRLIFDNASLDRLLVVTFTKAAARQMKDKIYEKLVHYKQELIQYGETGESLNKINKAINDINLSEIMTIDAFCNKLVRNYYLLLDIEPNFRIMDSKEEYVLASEVMEDLFEEVYKMLDGDEKDNSIIDKINWGNHLKDELRALINNFCIDEDDSELKSVISRLKSKSYNYEDGYKWLQNSFDTDEILASYFDKMNRIIGRLYDVENLILSMENANKGGKTLEKLLILKDELSKLELSQDVEINVNLINDVIEKCDLSRLSIGKAGKNDNPLEIEKLKKMLDEFKSTLALFKINLTYFSGSTSIKDTINEEKKYTQRFVPILILLIKLYSDELYRRKKDKNSYTFADIQRFAIQLLYNEDELSDIANELKSHYIDIYIDEYQDSNFIQEKILTAISNGKNMFMVGDMKQSIYRFRGAEPELFNDKYNSYADSIGKMTGNMGVRMNMSTNYRSSNIVLNDVNKIFNRIMKKEVGGIEFNKHHELKVAQHNEFSLQLMQNEYVEIPQKERKDEIQLANEEREIIYVINRISDLIKNGKVYYKSGDEIKSRAVNYGDINILFYRKTHLDTYIKYLDEANIPYHTVSRMGFFDTREINFMISFLKLIDNPYLDIETVGILHSALFNVTDDELLCLSDYKKEKALTSYYDAILSATDDSDLDIKLIEKLSHFIDEMKYLRNLYIYSDIYEIISTIYERYGICSMFSLLSNGESRRGNLELLLKLANDFIDIGETTIHSFIVYIEELKSKKQDIDSASLDATNNAVNLQTIHVSKGLEAEFIFIVGSNYGGRSNEDNNIKIYDKYGYIFPKYDADKKELYYPHLIDRYLKNKLYVDEIGEALRVLYVALTRAKQKYIVVNTVGKKKGNLDMSIYDYIDNEVEKNFNLYTLFRFNKDLNCVYPEENEYTKFEVAKSMSIAPSDFEKVEKTVNNFIKNVGIEKKVDKVVPKTISVSELKRIQNDIKPYIEANPDDKYRYKGNGTEYGVAFHNVMKYLDFTDVDRNLDILIDRYFKKIKKRPKKDAFLNFFNSEIGQRAIQAAKVHNIFKEEKFRNVYNRQSVRGMIDLFFIENGEIILLDYKTDAYRSEKKFIDSYEVQIRAYADVLEKVWGKKVREAYIYSFSLNKNILIIDNRQSEE